MKLARSFPAKIGFIISAYKRPDLMVRLVNSLDGRPCSIHVDKRSAILQELQQALQKCANVTFLKQHRVHWGDFGHVAASLEGLRWFRATSLDYAILLTGQCYPLVPIGDIETYLGELGEKSLIQHEVFPLPSRHFLRVEFDRLLARLLFRLRGRLDDNCDYVPSTKPSYWGDRGAARIHRYHLIFRGRCRKAPFLVRNLPLQLHPYGGSSYWCLSRKCVDYILNFCDENPEIIRFFKNVWIPNEAFFQTILGNSYLRSELIDEEIHYLEWENRNSPNILTSAEKALASGRWFGRKFESNDVLDEIDRQVAYRAKVA